MENVFSRNLKEASDLLTSCLENREFLSSLDQAGNLLAESLAEGKRVYSCGNGGSMCDAMHFAEELTGRFIKDRKAIPAMAMGDSSHISCTANDYGYDHIFSRIISAWGQSGDIMLAISTSGNSENVIRAVNEAKKKGVKTIALLGKDGGKLKDMVEAPIVVPSKTTARIQEIHIKIIHSLIECVERKMHPELY